MDKSIKSLLDPDEGLTAKVRGVIPYPYHERRKIIGSQKIKNY